MASPAKAGLWCLPESLFSNRRAEVEFGMDVPRSHAIVECRNVRPEFGANELLGPIEPQRNELHPAPLFLWRQLGQFLHHVFEFWCHPRRTHEPEGRYLRR